MSRSEVEGPYYMDTSVLLRIILGHSGAAAEWFEERIRADDDLVTSRLAQLETIRVLRREGIEPDLGTEIFDRMTLLSVDDELLDEAGALVRHIKSLDAIHLASAQRVGADDITVITHDQAMLRTAEELGFSVHDPVSD